MQRMLLSVCSLLVFVTGFAMAQPEGARGTGTPDDPFVREPDPRAIQRTYYYKEAGKDMPYVLYVSSKVDPATPAPLIIALHGMGGDGNFLLRDRLIDLAEEGGYIVAAPMGYHVAGWYGSPVITIPRGTPVEPPNLAELSEGDVMNVLDIVRSEFKTDPDRTYLMGHSMGGAGTFYLGMKHPELWAAIAAIAPASFLVEKDRIANIADMPVFLIHGVKDPAVPLAEAHKWVEAMRANDMDFEYQEIGQGDHGNVIGLGMPDIFEFFAGYSKHGDE
jgi:predicted peptidase